MIRDILTSMNSGITRRAFLLRSALSLLGASAVTAFGSANIRNSPGRNFSSAEGDSLASGDGIALPDPVYNNGLTVEKALEQRRSIRRYTNDSLTLEQITQILWAAQGITERRDRPAGWPENWQWFGGLRTAPSAGALYPIELYLAAGNVQGLESGVYKYNPDSHKILRTQSADIREELSRAAGGQDQVRTAPAVITIGAVHKRTAVKYRDRATRYVHIEVGHVGQNIYLQAESLELATVMVGAFSDDRVHNVLQMTTEESPLGIMPIGYPA